MRIIGRITGEGFTSIIKEADADRAGFKRVFYWADGDIDADGANGQNGALPAYCADNKGSEALANGGMAIRDGKVICAKSWARDIVILGKDNQPKVFKQIGRFYFPKGVIASRTWYRHPGMKVDDPAAYLDSETVPYIVVPPMIVQGVSGIVRGSKCRVTYGNKTVEGVVGDLGPRTKVGEISIEMARQLGIRSNPRNGGIDTPDLYYEIWPGLAAEGYTLERA